LYTPELSEGSNAVIGRRSDTTHGFDEVIMSSASVVEGYRHRDKFCWPREGAAIGGARLKWYDIAPSETPVPPEIAALARAFLKREDPEPGGDLGFVILHRCGAAFYVLIVVTWRNENEMWESVYAKRSDDDADFSEFPHPGPHRGTFCVWELGAVVHEKDAFRRYLLTSRDEVAKRAYLADRFEGIV
jgi:hypothetical protein